jgi:hypothetical protein
VDPSGQGGSTKVSGNGSGTSRNRTSRPTSPVAPSLRAPSMPPPSRSAETLAAQALDAARSKTAARGIASFLRFSKPSTRRSDVITH